MLINPFIVCCSCADAADGDDEADAAEAAVRPRLLVQRGRERRERQRAEKAAAAAAAAKEAAANDGAAGDQPLAGAGDGVANRLWLLGGGGGGGGGLVRRLRLATAGQATMRAIGEWRTVAANAAGLVACAAFVALATHVIRSQAGDE